MGYKNHEHVVYMVVAVESGQLSLLLGLLVTVLGLYGSSWLAIFVVLDVLIVNGESFINL